jgi:hypothetical protein
MVTSSDQQLHALCSLGIKSSSTMPDSMEEPQASSNASLQTNLKIRSQNFDPDEITCAGKINVRVPSHPPKISLTKVANCSPYQIDSGREKELLEHIRASPNLEQMRANPAKVAERIQLFSGTQQFLMDIGVDKADKIVEIITRVRPLVFVELRGYLGYSAIRFVQAMVNALPVGSGLKVQYWSLEFNEEFAQIAEEMVELAGLSEVVKVCFDQLLPAVTYINGL